MSDGTHNFLSIGKYHRNVVDAEKHVLDLLHRSAPGRSRSSWRGRDITVTDGNRTTVYKFDELVFDTRKRGYCHALQTLLDRRDPYFGGRVEISTNGEAMTIGSMFAGENASGRGPASSVLVEKHLAEDIRVGRQRICANSERSAIDWLTIGRHYRSYVFACCAVVEYFMNHTAHVAIAQHGKSEDLLAPSPFEERLSRWLNALAPKLTMTALRQTPEWCHSSELRDQRNELIHGVRPVHVVSLREMPRALNAARTGIGNLLCMMRRGQGLQPLGFMLMLSTLPPVSFQSHRRGKSSRHGA